MEYLKSREQALEEAYGIIAEGRGREACGPYGRLLSVLVDHYMDLLRAKAGDMDSLLRCAYGSRVDNLLYFNQITQAQKRLNAALWPHLGRGERERKEIDAAISRIKQVSGLMRREEASRVFG